MVINAAREQTAFGGSKDRDQITVATKSHSKQDRKQQLNIGKERSMHVGGKRMINKCSSAVRPHH